MKVAIIDYGMGNLNSVKKALSRIGVEGIVSKEPSVLSSVDKLILPGVGNFNLGMKHLRDQNLIELLNELVLVHKKPILGICLGMQLLTDHSEEGNSEGLKWIPGNTIKFNVDMDSHVAKRFLKVPHIGWNSLNIKSGQDTLFKAVPNGSPQYFVHSYYVKCKSPENVLASADYGMTFDASIARDNIFGTQFHPEKSHQIGLQILKNFTSL